VGRLWTGAEPLLTGKIKRDALADMGLTLQARWMLGRELRAGTLVDVFPDYQVTAALDEADAWLLYPSRKYVPQKVELFVAYLREQFRNGPPWDRPAPPQPPAARGSRRAPPRRVHDGDRGGAG